jgi:hypothetical protein
VRHPLDPGPVPLVAHRCAEHLNVTPINNKSAALVVYVAEKQPTAFPLGKGRNGEEITAECGGCLAEEVEGLYQLNLDLLDLVAATLISRAELRRKLRRYETFT